MDYENLFSFHESYDHLSKKPGLKSRDFRALGKRPETHDFCAVCTF